MKIRAVGAAVLLIVIGVGALTWALTRESEAPVGEASESAISRFDSDQVVGSGKLESGADWVAVSDERGKEACVYIHLVEAVDQDQVVDGGCFGPSEVETRVARMSESAYFVFGRLDSDSASSDGSEVEVSSDGGKTTTMADNDGMFTAFSPDEPETLTYEDAEGKTQTQEIAD